MLYPVMAVRLCLMTVCRAGANDPRMAVCLHLMAVCRARANDHASMHRIYT